MGDHTHASIRIITGRITQALKENKWRSYSQSFSLAAVIQASLKATNASFALPGG